MWKRVWGKRTISAKKGEILREGSEEQGRRICYINFPICVVIYSIIYTHAHMPTFRLVHPIPTVLLIFIHFHLKYKFIYLL